MTKTFRDRREAGRLLGERLAGHAGRDVVVEALPRGGVPVGFEVAVRLGAPLDVLVVRKLGHPGQPELALGAIASGGVLVVNEEVVAAERISDGLVERLAQQEAHELERRERLYRGPAAPIPVEGCTAVVVDDGLATGSTMRAAVRALRCRAPARVVVAVPVAARPTCEALAEETDEVVCLRTPEFFFAVGQWYADFSQTTDDEVRSLLGRALSGSAAPR